MAGHARQRRPGVWELRAYAGRDPITRRKRYATKTVRAAGKKEAARLADDFARSLDGGGTHDRSITVAALFDRWIAAGGPGRSPASEYHARWRADHYLAGLADRPVVDVRTLDLDDFYAALRERGNRKGGPLAVSTVRRLHTDVRLAFEQAVRWGIIPRNPADDANPGRGGKTRIRPPAPGHVTAMLAAAEHDPELLTYVFLDAETGARRGEAAALRLDDFRDDATVEISRALAIGLASEKNARDYAGHYWPSTVRRGDRPTALIEKEPKTEESTRRIALAAPTIELVRGQAARLANRAAMAGAQYPAGGFLFPADALGRRPLRPDTWTHRWSRLRAELGVPFRLHDLRHFVATTMLTSGVDLATVAGRLGHGGGGKTTLAIYSHFLAEPDRAASDVMAAILIPPSEPQSNVVPIRSRAR